MLSFLRLNFLPASVDLGLLLLRATAGGSMLWLHGKGKMMEFATVSEKFPAVIGNPKISLGLTIFAEVFCAGLLVLGLFGRFAALALSITMGVAFFITHKMALTGEHSGETAFLFLIAYAALFLTGPGKFSLDGGGSK